MSYLDYALDPGNPPDVPPVAPPWLKNPNGQAWLTGIALSLDDDVDRAKQAVKARFPLICPTDALPYIGASRGLPQGPSETTASYRARLQAAWTLWQYAGTPYGILAALYAAGFPGAAIFTQGGQKHVLAGGYNPLAPSPTTDLVTTSLGTVHLGGTPELWNQFRVIIYPALPAAWGGTIPGYGSNDQRFVAALVKQWMPAHARIVGLAVTSDAAWNGAATWGAGTWDSTHVAWSAIWGNFDWGDGTLWGF